MGTWYFFQPQTVIGHFVAVVNGGYGGAYDTVHDAAIGTVSANLNVAQSYTWYAGYEVYVYIISRAGIRIDASRLPVTDTVTAAVLNLAEGGILGYPTVETVVHLVDGSDIPDPMDGTHTEVYGSLLDEVVSRGSIAVPIGGLPTDSYSALTLNAVGRGEINSKADMWFGIRVAGDISDTAPAEPDSEYSVYQSCNFVEGSSTDLLYLASTTVTRFGTSMRFSTTISVDNILANLTFAELLAHFVVTTDGETNGSNLDIRFQYGVSSVMENTTDWITSAEFDITHEVVVGSLDASKTYKYRIQVACMGVTITGSTGTASPGGVAYPSDALTRVTGLIHRYSPREGDYTLEMFLGDVTAEWDVRDYLYPPGAAAPASAGGISPLYPSGPGYPQQDPNYVPPHKDPVVISCPPGTRMVYSDWDTQRQYPTCEKLPTVAEKPWYYSSPGYPVPGIGTTKPSTTQMAKSVAKVVATPGALPSLVEQAASTVSSKSTGALSVFADIVSKIYKAMNPFSWFR